MSLRYRSSCDRVLETNTKVSSSYHAAIIDRRQAEISGCSMVSVSWHSSDSFFDLT